MLASPWLYVILALATLALAGAALWGHLRFWVARLSLPLPYAVEEVLHTEDGARIELRRVPRGEFPARPRPLPPVLLVHGLAANHRNQDLHPDCSLARHLAAAGRDVWLLTLRSGRARGWSERQKARFAAMVRHDLPLAVETVLARTGQRRLDYVGFSMGGMLLYAALGRSVPPARVRRAVFVGSPGRVAPSRLLRLVPRALVPGLPFRFLARVVAFAAEWLSTPLHHAVANPRNFAPGMMRLILVNVVEDVPAALNRDFLAWAKGDGEIRVDGERALDGLASVGIPALFIAGSADRVAPVGAVRRAFEAWGHDRPGTPKRLIELGQGGGARADYGHGDLAVGAYAADELFAPIARFLEEDAPEDAPEAAVEAAAEEGLPAAPVA